MLAPSVVSAFLVGCATSYVDAQLPKVSYADLLARRDPRPVVLSVGFQRNGDPTMLGASRARRDIREVVERSKLFSSVIEKQTDTADQLDVVLNNVGDVGEAAAKGAKVGATFGASGALVTDAFVFTATFRPAGKEAVTKVYRHAMHSAVGSAEGPPGLVPMGPLQAFDKIIEDLMLNLLRDLQREELL
jgi:hypothetical protein